MDIEILEAKISALRRRVSHLEGRLSDLEAKLAQSVTPSDILSSSMPRRAKPRTKTRKKKDKV